MRSSPALVPIFGTPCIGKNGRREQTTVSKCNFVTINYLESPRDMQTSIPSIGSVICEIDFQFIEFIEEETYLA